MTINLSKLENVQPHGSKTIARCPACAETGNDRKGEHLFIGQSGKFGCVAFPGPVGHKHRQRIFELAGIKSVVTGWFKIKTPQPRSSANEVTQKDILGRLGHFQSTHACKRLGNSPSRKETSKESPTGVPIVPEISRQRYSITELGLLQKLDAESVQCIDKVKRIFNCTIVSVVDTKH